jgi:type I pantothenate kinase
VNGAGAVAALIERRRPSPTPVLVGIAGAVAAGKTRLAEDVAAELPGTRVEVVPTDGFLFPNAVLAARGLVARKGFPESYDRDALRAFLAAAGAGRLPRRVPHYSHLVYDIDGEREVGAADVVVVEGVNILSAAADLLDLRVYLEAAEADLAAWFRQRFLALRTEGRDDPTSFYRSFAEMGDAEVAAFADTVWREVNLVNLRDHIAPSRRLADVVITKGRDHTVTGIAVRDDVPERQERA